MLSGIIYSGIFIHAEVYPMISKASAHIVPCIQVGIPKVCFTSLIAAGSPVF
jgi:hypothetical protein